MEKQEIKLPADFASYGDARRAGFLKMKELKENGARVVGMFCSFVPTELVYAAGALPVGLCAFTDEPIPAAEAHLPRNLCPLIKASYGFALTDTCPYFYFSDLVVGETTCDGKKKMFELLDEIKETYVMQLPHSRDERSLAFWRGEIVAFKEKLEDFFGIQITEEAIRQAIRRKNRERQVMRRYLELGKLDPAPMSGYEMGTRVDAGSFSFDLDQRCDEVESRTAEVLARWEAELKGTSTDRRPGEDHPGGGRVGGRRGGLRHLQRHPGEGRAGGRERERRLHGPGPEVSEHQLLRHEPQ